MVKISKEGLTLIEMSIYLAIASLMGRGFVYLFHNVIESSTFISSYENAYQVGFMIRDLFLRGNKEGGGLYAINGYLLKAEPFYLEYRDINRNVLRWRWDSKQRKFLRKINNSPWQEVPYFENVQIFPVGRRIFYFYDEYNREVKENWRIKRIEIQFYCKVKNESLKVKFGISPYNCW